MGMGVVDPHFIDMEGGKRAIGYPFEVVDVHDAEAACGKEKCQAAEQKSECGMVEVLFEKVVEVDGETAEKRNDAEKQGVADKHHAEVVAGENNNKKEQNSSDKHIKPEAEEAIDQLTLWGFAPGIAVKEAHDADAERE